MIRIVRVGLYRYYWRSEIMTNIILKIIAWLSLTAIAIATIGPITMRPESGTSPDWERFAAFALVGFLFSFAYRKRLMLALLILLASALGLEILQLVVPGRHGHVSDLLVKVTGAMLGVIVAVAMGRTLRIDRSAS